MPLPVIDSINPVGEKCCERENEYQRPVLVVPHHQITEESLTVRVAI